MLYEMNDHKAPNAYQSFLNILAKNKLDPAKPIDTFEGFKKGDFSLPELLQDRNVEQIGQNGEKLELYRGTPSLGQFPAYAGMKA